MTTQEAKDIAMVYLKKKGYPHKEVRDAFKHIMTEADQWKENMPEGNEKTVLCEILHKIKDTERTNEDKTRDIANFFEEYLLTRWDKYGPFIV